MCVGGGGTGAPTAMNQLWGGPACKRLKTPVLEEHSLSEVKMGRGSPICERVRKKIVESFKNNVPQHQIAKAFFKYHHLQYITSSKDSEKLDKSL